MGRFLVLEGESGHAMPRGKRILVLGMWGAGLLAAAAALACIVVANFFFPGADQTQYLDELAQNPPTTTFFHRNEPASIRAWKISLTVLGCAVAATMLQAFLYGIFYPPPEEPPATTAS